MKRSLPWLLLAASVGFNIFFAIGYVQARSMAEDLQSFEGRFRLFAEQLELDADQMAEFERVLAHTAERRRVYKRDQAPRIKALLEQIASDEPDEQWLDQFVAEDWQRPMREMFVDQLRRMMQILRPEQRKQFAQMLHERFAKPD